MRTGEQGWLAPEILPPIRPWPGAAPGRVLQGLTVLLVEDSRLASEAMRLLCRRSGARLRRADCQAAALRHLRAYRPAVVIVDIGLPDADGVALIAALAAMRPRVPVVLGISGDPDRRGDALAAGADGFLAKPVSSLAGFQQAILGALPPEAHPRRPWPVTGDGVELDRIALRDDLAYLAGLLAPGMGLRQRLYAAQFLHGLGQVAGEALLIRAAAELAGEDGEAMIPRLRAWLEQRLAGGQMM